MGATNNNQFHGAERKSTFKYYGEGSWRKSRIKFYGSQCALCHRAIRIDETVYKAVFRADRGVYVQIYHPACAALRQSVGDRPEFQSARSAVEWAEDNGCRGCDKARTGCTMRPFDCMRCMDTLRVLGELEMDERPAEDGEEDE